MRLPRSRPKIASLSNSCSKCQTTCGHRLNVRSAPKVSRSKLSPPRKPCASRFACHFGWTTADRITRGGISADVTVNRTTSRTGLRSAGALVQVVIVEIPEQCSYAKQDDVKHHRTAPAYANVSRVFLHALGPAGIGVGLIRRIIVHHHAVRLSVVDGLDLAIHINIQRAVKTGNDQFVRSRNHHLAIAPVRAFGANDSVAGPNLDRLRAR